MNANNDIANEKLGVKKENQQVPQQVQGAKIETLDIEQAQLMGFQLEKPLGTIQKNKSKLVSSQPTTGQLSYNYSMVDQPTIPIQVLQSSSMANQSIQGWSIYSQPMLGQFMQDQYSGKPYKVTCICKVGLFKVNLFKVNQPSFSTVKGLLCQIKYLAQLHKVFSNVPTNIP